MAWRSTGIQPGAIMFTVMFHGASSLAIDRDQPICPPFAATYALNGATPRLNTSLVMLMMRPHFCCFMCGSTSRVIRYGLFTKKSYIDW